MDAIGESEGEGENEDSTLSLTQILVRKKVLSPSETTSVFS